MTTAENPGRCPYGCPRYEKPRPAPFVYQLLRKESSDVVERFCLCPNANLVKHGATSLNGLTVLCLPVRRRL